MTKSNFQTSYFQPNEVKSRLWSTQYLEKLNVLHVNIRSIKSNFEKIKALLEECELVCNVICVPETWCSNTELQNNSNLDSVPYKRSKKSKRGGGVLIIIRKNLFYKIWKDLSESDEHTFPENILKNSSNILLSSQGWQWYFKHVLKTSFWKVCCGKETLLSCWRSQRKSESFSFLQFPI